MSIKKMLSLALALVMVFSLAACGSGSASSSTVPAGSTAGEPASSEPAAAGDTVRVGVVTPDADHGFTGESVAHARAELEKLAGERGFEYKFEVGGEADTQIAAIEAILQWGPDVIVLWPLEGDLLRSTAQKIQDEGVDLVIYDRLIDGFVPAAEMMGDNETIGGWMGEYLLSYFADQLAGGEKITYLRFIGDSSTVSIQRSGGMDSVIAGSEYAAQFEQVQADYLTNWSNSTALDQIDNWLNTASPETIEALDLIVTHDDEIVDGIVVALQNYNDSNPSAQLNVKLITSVGGRRETLATFDNPVANGIELVTYNFSPSMIREAVRLGVAIAYDEQYNGKDPSGMILIDSIEVDKNNVDEFRASDVFTERYSLS